MGDYDQRRADANDAVWDRLTAGLTNDEMATFAMHLHGALSGYIDPATYARLAEGSRTFVTRTRAGRQMGVSRG